MGGSADIEPIYQWFGASLPEAGQPDSSNADCLSSAHKLAQREGFLGVVCDGVSSSAHGKRAAFLACGTIASSFQHDWTGSEEPESWLRAALGTAHQRVRKEYPWGDALCAVVSALVVSGERRFAVAHAGDSGAYRFRDGELVKLTRDHSTSVPVHMDGTVALQQGVPLVARGLTLTLGQTQDFRPEAAAYDYEEGDMLCLASDGVQESRLARFLRQSGWSLDARKVQEFCARMREDSQDDTTLLLIRLGQAQAMRDAAGRLAGYGGLGPGERDALLARLGGEMTLAPSAFTRCLETEDDESRAIKIVDLMARDPSELTRDGWIRRLDTAIQRGHWKLAARLKAIIRRL